MAKLLSLLLLLGGLLGAAEAGSVYVRPYIRSDGTYVEGHYRSTPDGNPYNNWSTRGNVNPYTGQQGTFSPYQLRGLREFTPSTIIPPCTSKQSYFRC